MKLKQNLNQRQIFSLFPYLIRKNYNLDVNLEQIVYKLLEMAASSFCFVDDSLLQSPVA